jgi:predicted acyltransferase
LYWIILLLFGEGGDPYNMLTNAGSKLDNFLLGANHLYHGEGVAFDPEGLLSTLPSIVNVTFGWLAGRWIQQKIQVSDPKQSGAAYEGLSKLLMAGAILIALALAWHPFFPINKKLWTGSFVFLTIGIDCILLSFLIYITEFEGRRKWGWFFEVLGKNPLVIYLISELAAILLWFFGVGDNYQPLYNWIFEHVFSYAGMYFGSFLFAICFMLFCWTIGYIMDKRKIYIRV